MLDFRDAKLLSYTQRNKFAGENFRYGSEKVLSIEGTIFTGNTDGVAPVWQRINDLVSGAIDYEDISINGINFGSGIIYSLQFKEGQHVQKADYTIGLTIFDTGNLFNLTGPFYEGLDFTNPNYPAYLLENFNENFDFTIKDDGSYAYSQNVNLKFVSGKLAGNNNSAIDMARGFASGLLFSSPAFGLIDSAHSGFYNTSGRRTYSESYNLITNECSFSEKFEIDGYPSGNYSIKYNTQLDTDENGSTNVTENGVIKGLLPPFNPYAEQGFAIQLPLMYGRCSEALEFYLGSGTNPLRNGQVASSKKINTLIGEIDYSYTFTNNPAYNLTYAWDYTQEIRREPTKCFYMVEERGRIRGIDNCLLLERYNNALAQWSIVQGTITGRLHDFYISSSQLNNTLKAVSTSQKSDPNAGVIEYGLVYTDDLLYNIAPGIKRLDYEIEDSTPVVKSNRFNVLRVGEIVQPANVSTEGTYGMRIKIIGERGVDMIICINAAKDIMTRQDIRPPNPSFLTTVNYSFIPYESTLNANVVWKYFTPAASSNFV